jgi:CHAT domain
MFAKLHLLSQDAPESGGGLRWRAHPYLRMVGAVPKGPAVFNWNARQREDLEALWQDPDAAEARERLAGDLAAFCDKLGWVPDAAQLEDAEKHGDEYLVTLSAVPPELYLLPWEVIQVGAAGRYLSDYASAQVRYAVPGLEPREILAAPPAPGVLFAWSSAGGAVPREEQAAAIRAAAEAGGVTFRELAEVDEASLLAALDAGPPSVLHLLCHGLPGPEGEPPRLKWGPSDSPSEITAPHLARMLRRHNGTIRLVVLSACGSGDGHGDPLFMGSIAQELHRNGIPNVVASRYPLSVRGSRVMTRALYDKLLREAWSLERALRHTRAVLFHADEDGEAHPGDAYGIQLYAYDTERFVSDNNAVAERPVLASYPFGTAARPVPASGPPAAELTLRVEADPELPEEQLVEKLRGVSEDERLAVARSPGERSLIVRTTVDGAQRLLGAWRSKALQTAVGVIVGELILTKGITPALAGTSSAAAGKAAKATGHQAASGNAAAPGQAATGQAGTAAGQAGTAAGQAATATTGKAAAGVAGKVLTAKLALAVAGSLAVVIGGVAVYRAQTRSPAPVSPGVDATIVDAVIPLDAASAPPERDAPSGETLRSLSVVSPPDAARPDAARPDAARPDASSPDAARPDGAPPDASSPDGAPPDAALPDASLPDAAPPDASLPDAAPPDTSLPDAAPPDAATAPGSSHGNLALTLKKGTVAKPYLSRNYGQEGTGKVGFIVPSQASASGPDSMVQEGTNRDAKLIVSTRSKTTGAPQPITLRGFKPSTGCGHHVQMNDVPRCEGVKESVLELTIVEEDNAAAPAGVYVGSFLLKVQRAGDKTFVEDLTLDYEITVLR